VDLKSRSALQDRAAKKCHVTLEEAEACPADVSLPSDEEVKKSADELFERGDVVVPVAVGLTMPASAFEAMKANAQAAAISLRDGFAKTAGVPRETVVIPTDGINPPIGEFVLVYDFDHGHGGHGGDGGGGPPECVSACNGDICHDGGIRSGCSTSSCSQDDLATINSHCASQGGSHRKLSDFDGMLNVEFNVAVAPDKSDEMTTSLTVIKESGTASLISSINSELSSNIGAAAEVTGATVEEITAAVQPTAPTVEPTAMPTPTPTTATAAADPTPKPTAAPTAAPTAPAATPPPTDKQVVDASDSGVKPVAVLTGVMLTLLSAMQ
jgi:cell division septation protein DedD